jgi:predicted lactoylglutathione lyase
MAGPELDGAGTQKLVVLEEALHTLTSVHATVERLASAVKNAQSTVLFYQQIKRQLAPLTTKLKMQFGMIADQLAAMLLASTRGSNEQMRVRAMREHVAQIKVALEIAVAQTVKKHAKEDPHKAKPAAE